MFFHSFRCYFERLRCKYSKYKEKHYCLSFVFLRGFLPLLPRYTRDAGFFVTFYHFTLHLHLNFKSGCLPNIALERLYCETQTSPIIHISSGNSEINYRSCRKTNLKIKHRTRTCYVTAQVRVNSIIRLEKSAIEKKPKVLF